MKGGANFGAGGFRTTDDLFNNFMANKANQSVSIGGIGTNITTNISQDEYSKHLNLLSKYSFQSEMCCLDKSVANEHADNLLLPSIKSVRRG